MKRHRAEERAVGGVDDDAVARRTSVGGDEMQVAAQRLQRPACRTGCRIDAQRIRVPRLSRLPDGEHHALAARRSHDEPHRCAANQIARRRIDHGPREERAAPRVDRPEDDA
jgi:hypothetical protein